MNTSAKVFLWKIPLLIISKFYSRISSFCGLLQRFHYINNHKWMYQSLHNFMEGTSTYYERIKQRNGKKNSHCNYAPFIWGKS